jgi:hypothetical protein
MKKIIKVSTVPMSLDTFCRGQLKMLCRYFDVVAVSSPDSELKEIEKREEREMCGCSDGATHIYI